jgi:transposase
MTAPPLPPSIWEQTPPPAQEMRLRQAAELAHLRAEVAQWPATVDAWARRLGRTSRTSSQPPSADPPHARSQRARHEPRGRRPGGQPGHEGQARAVVPVEVVDVVMPLRPGRCAHGQHLLRGEEPAPERHQVAEIPSMRPVITAYQVHRVVCPGGGHAPRAAWPEGRPTGGFGPRVQAITALGTGRTTCPNAPPRAS